MTICIPNKKDVHLTNFNLSYLIGGSFDLFIENCKIKDKTKSQIISSVSSMFLTFCHKFSEKFYFKLTIYYLSGLAKILLSFHLKQFSIRNSSTLSVNLNNILF